MATLISHSARETETLGEAWGRAAESGWVICLCGELGAGKTQLVRGLACGIGISDRVHSPTFTLVNIIAAGLEEYLNPAGVTVIEWAEKWFGSGSQKSKVQSPKCKGKACLRWVQIESLSETERRIMYEDFGT